MTNQNSWGLHPYEHGTRPAERLAHVINVKDDVGADGTHTFRCQVRFQDQTDQGRIPDENCEWVTVETPTTNKGGTPYIKPGMIVRCGTMSGTPGIGSAYVSSVVSYKPADAESGNSNGPKRAGTDKTAQPREASDTYPYDKYSQSQDPIKNTTTMASVAADSSIPSTDQAHKEVALAKKNRFDEQNGAKFTAFG